MNNKLDKKNLKFKYEKNEEWNNFLFNAYITDYINYLMIYQWFQALQ